MRALALVLVIVATGTVHASPRHELTVNGGEDQVLFGGLAFANDGALYVAGTFFRKVTLGGKQLRAAKAEHRDGFVARIEDGKVAWLVRAGGISDIAAIAAAPNGDLVVGGMHEYRVGQEAGPLTDWRMRAAVVRIDAKGTQRWHREFPSIDRSLLGDIAVAVDDSVIAVGGYADKTTFGGQVLPSIAVKNAWGVTLPSFDVFVTKLRATDGTVEWVATGGGGERDTANAVAITKTGDIVIAGEIAPHAKFGTTHLTGPVAYPQQQRLANPSWPFVARYGASGALKWAVEIPAHDIAFVADDAVVALDDDSVLVHAGDHGMGPNPGDPRTEHAVIAHVKADGTLTKRNVDEADAVVRTGTTMIAARVTADALVFEEHGPVASARKTAIARRLDATTGTGRKMGKFELKPYAFVRAPDGRYALAALVGAMTENRQRSLGVTFGSITPVLVIAKDLDQLLPTKSR
jgi:hypothetical protein